MLAGRPISDLGRDLLDSGTGSGTHSAARHNTIKYSSALVIGWCPLFVFKTLTTWNLYLPASVSWSRKSTSCHVFVATEYRVSRDTVAGCNPL